MKKLSGNPVLLVKDLEISFGDKEKERKVVDGVSFSLEAGKTLGIVGESGSGKTLSSLAVMGLLPPGAKTGKGQILFRNGPGEMTDLLRSTESEIRKHRGRDIAMIFQEPMSSLNPVMRCGKQVTESLELHLGMSKGEARSRCIELFREVRLPRPEKIFQAYPHQLSGGQKQRVMIAMALSCKPSLLIADEPTTALDVSVQKSILELMKELLRKHNTSLIFITHDLGVIRQIADEVLVMQEGKIVEQGLVEKVFDKPEHPYTQGLMACRPEMGRRPKRLLTVGDFLREGKDGHPKAALETKEERKLRHEAIYKQDPLLRIEGLSTWFPVRSNILGKSVEYLKAVEDVSFNLYLGETLGLVGESGSGKTTLGRTILRLIKEHQGDIFYRGEKINDKNGEALRKLRREMQIIFQDPFASLNPRMTAGEAIVEPMRVHRLFQGKQERRKQAFMLLERVGLEEEHFFRYPHEFSGGQRQRLGIARALALQPSFIVCDESVSALDVSVQAQVLNLLNDLKEDFGLTYIFISHDLSVVRYMSDRIIVLKDGRLIEEGESDTLVESPEKAYTQNLIEAIPELAN